MLERSLDSPGPEHKRFSSISLLLCKILQRQVTFTARLSSPAGTFPRTAIPNQTSLKEAARLDLGREPFDGSGPHTAPRTSLL